MAALPRHSSARMRDLEAAHDSVYRMSGRPALTASPGPSRAGHRIYPLSCSLSPCPYALWIPAGSPASKLCGPSRRDGGFHGPSPAGNGFMTRVSGPSIDASCRNNGVRWHNRLSAESRLGSMPPCLDNCLFAQYASMS